MSDLEKTIVDGNSGKNPGVNVPEKIGPYRVKGLLRRGGIGILYLGMHPDTDELLAVKVLSPEYVSHPEMVDRFLREAHIIEMADHPNIVRLYGHGKWEGGVYIAMEFIRGISLRKLILQNGLSFRRSLEIILETGMALSHLHAHGVIHRDVKPENILLSEEGGVKVIDFGIARLRGDPNGRSEKQKLAGTLTYMSPEQKEHPLLISYATDIYSLAIVTYELCLGKLCYGVIQLSLLPKGLRVILSKALQTNPSDRQVDMNEFVSELNHYLNSVFEKNEDLTEYSLPELSELYENISFHLKPSCTLPLHRFSVGVDYPEGILSGNLYYDYLSLREEVSAVIIVVSEKEGALGMFHASFLKGAVQSLYQEVFSEGEIAECGTRFIERLQRLLAENGNSAYTFSFWIRDEIKHAVHYFHAGSGGLWSVSSGSTHVRAFEAEGIPLGDPSLKEVVPITSNGHAGDLFILIIPLRKDPLKKEICQKAIETSLSFFGDKQAAVITEHMAELAREKYPMFVLSVQIRG